MRETLSVLVLLCESLGSTVGRRLLLTAVAHGRFEKPSVTQVLCFCYRAIQFAKTPDATEADKMMCTCISCYAGMIKMIKGARQIFSREEAGIFKELKLGLLRSYTWVHKRGLTLSHRLPAKGCYLLLPKMRVLWHLCQDVRSTRLNPAAAQLSSGESFIGAVGRIARACHKSSVNHRTLHRYLSELHKCMKRYVICLICAMQREKVFLSSRASRLPLEILCCASCHLTIKPCYLTMFEARCHGPMR